MTNTEERTERFDHVSFIMAAEAGELDEDEFNEGMGRVNEAVEPKRTTLYIKDSQPRKRTALSDKKHQ